MSKMSLQNVVDLVTIFQGIFTILAIIVGGFWSYMLFVRRRQRYPRANLSHALAHRALVGNKVLLHVRVSIFNPGEVLLTLRKGEVWIQQILPVTPQLMAHIEAGNDPVIEGRREVDWPLICSRSTNLEENRLELEPGETHSIDYDFIIEKHIRCIEIYSVYWSGMRTKHDLVWNLVTIHDLNYADN